jgi:hypothetical protein
LFCNKVGTEYCRVMARATEVARASHASTVPVAF